MPRRIAYSGTISRVRSGKRRGLPPGVPADYCQRVADICDNLGEKDRYVSAYSIGGGARGWCMCVDLVTIVAHPKRRLPEQLWLDCRRRRRSIWRVQRDRNHARL